MMNIELETYLFDAKKYEVCAKSLQAAISKLENVHMNI